MKSPKPGKLDLSQNVSPLQSSAFGALEKVDTSSLPPGQSLPVKSEKVSPGSKQRLVLRREKKDRGGKTVVVISGYQGNPQFQEELARKLRKQLGCGGTIEQGEIIIQGDQPSAVAQALKKMGYQVAGVGV